jgi:hypothetical protein
MADRDNSDDKESGPEYLLPSSPEESPKDHDASDDAEQTDHDI